MLDLGVLVACAPWTGNGAETDIKEALRCLGKPRKGAKRVLAGHFGVADDDTPPWLRKDGSLDWISHAELCELCLRAGVSHVFCGHWHKRKHWPGVVEVLQLGTLAPIGFSDVGLEGYGTVARFSGSHVDIAYVPGPRFIELGASDAIPSYAVTHEGCSVFASIAHSGDMVERSAQAEVCVERGWLAAASVVPDEREQRTQMDAAARGARSSSTLAEAVEAFVASMPLDESVPREKVLSATRGYLHLPDEPGGPVHVRITASSVARALNCSWWARSDVRVFPAPSGQAAERGTLGHAILAARLMGQTPPAASVELMACVELALKWWSGLGLSPSAEVLVEQPLALDTRKLSARIPSSKGQRDYSRVLDHEVPGTADVLVDDPKRGLIVIDWKFSSYDPSRYREQLLTLSTMWAGVRGGDPVTAYALAVDRNVIIPRRWFFESEHMRDHACALAKVMEQLPSSEPHDGAHCKWCPAEHTCPLWRSR